MIKRHHLSLASHLHEKKTKLFISSALARFSLGLGSIFVPVYLYEIGWSLSSICLFFIATHCLRFTVYLPVFKLIVKHGAQRSLRLSYVLFAIQMFGLFILESFSLGIVIVSVASALANIIFWTSIHFDIVDMVEGKKMTKNVGVFVLLGVFVEALAPILGGVVGVAFGPQWIFFLSLLSLLIAIILIDTKADKTRHEGTIRIGRPNSITTRGVIANASDGYSSTISVFMWSMYIFLLLGGIDRLGYIIGFGLLAGGAIVALVAKYGDGNDKFFSFGYVWRILSFPLRFLSTTYLAVVTANTANAVLSSSIYGVPYASYYHQNAKQKDPYNFIFWVEIIRELAIVGAWLTLLILLQFFSDVEALKYSVLAASIVAPFTYFMRPRLNTK